MFRLTIWYAIVVSVVAATSANKPTEQFQLSAYQPGPISSSSCPKGSSLPVVNEIVHGLHFDVPDISFSNDSVTMHLTQVHLSDICLGEVAIKDSSTKTTETLQAVVTGVDAVVTTDFSIKATILGFIPINTKGHAKITIRNVRMDFGVRAPVDPHRLPKSLSAIPGNAGCVTDLAQKITLELTPKSVVIEELSKVATSIFGGVINNQLCATLRETVSSQLSPQVSSLYNWAKPFSGPPPSPVRPLVPAHPGLVDWSSEKVVETTAKLTGRLPGLLAQLAAGSAGPDGFSQLVTAGLGVSVPVKSTVMDALFKLEAVGVRGVDSTSVFLPLNAGDRMPSRELWSTFEEHQPLELRLNVSVTLTNPKSGDPIGPVLSPVVTLKLGVKKAWMRAVLPVKKEPANKLVLSQLTQPKCLEACVMNPFELYDAGFEVQWDQDTLVLNGLTKGLNLLAKQALVAINRVGAPFVTTVLPHFVSIEMPKKVNAAIKTFLKPDPKEECQRPSNEPDYIQWGDEKFFALASKLANDNVLPHLNEYVDKVLPSGRVHLESPLLHTSFKGFNISIPSLDIQGLDTFGSVEMLNLVPGKPYTLRNRFGIGNSKTPHREFTMTVQLELESDVNFKGQDLSHNDVTASYTLRDFDLELDVLLKVDRSEIRSWKLEYFLMMETQQPCFLAPIHQAEISKLEIDLESIAVDFHCNSCTAHDLQDLSRSLDTSLAKRLLSLAITKKLKEAFPVISGNGKDAANYALSHFLQEVSEECHRNATAPPLPPAPLPPAGDEWGVGAAVGLGAGVVATVGMLVVCFATPGQGSLHRVWRRESAEAAGAPYQALEDVEHRGSEGEEGTGQTDEAVARE